MEDHLRSETLNGILQSITNLSNIPMTKKGIELYYQHHIIGDGVRGKINVAMSTTMGDMKDIVNPFRKYINKLKVYVSQSSLGLVDAILFSVMLHTDPQDIKSSIFDIMHDDTPISVFAK
jgi:hypothetical protein